MTFQEEMQALGDWLMAETERCMSIPEIPGVLDGESSMELKKVTHEYNRKLLELKKKYHIREYAVK